VANYSNADVTHFVLTGSIVNNAYDPEKDRIELRYYKDGTLRDITEASDNLGIQPQARPRWLGNKFDACFFRGCFPHP